MALSRPNTRWIATPAIAYDGRQLRSHYIRSRFGLQGDAAVIFRGPCEVQADELVDLADREASLFIRSDEMLHLLVELFGPTLEEVILLQRLVAAQVAQAVAERIPERAAEVRRRGDDVFVGDGKLSVSIATASPLSSLIHFGINVVGTGAPVKVAALDDLGIDPAEFAQELLGALAEELDGVSVARAKVRAVGEYEG